MDAQRACKEYTTLMQIVHAGAYTEDEKGDSWYEAVNISERLVQLDRWAIVQGQHFVKQEESYVLEPATEEEIVAFKSALE